MNNSGKSSANHNSPNRLKLPFACVRIWGRRYKSFHITPHTRHTNCAAPPPHRVYLCRFGPTLRSLPASRLAKSVRPDSSLSRWELPTNLAVISFPPWTIQEIIIPPQTWKPKRYLPRWMNKKVRTFFAYVGGFLMDSYKTWNSLINFFKDCFRICFRDFLNSLSGIHLELSLAIPSRIHWDRPAKISSKLPLEISY